MSSVVPLCPRSFGVSQEDCPRLSINTSTHTHTRTNTQVILYLSNAMNCIGQTINHFWGGGVNLDNYHRNHGYCRLACVAVLAVLARVV